MPAPLLDLCRVGNPACGGVISHPLGSQLLGTAVCLTSGLSSSSKRTDYILYRALSFRFRGDGRAPLSHV